jgi:hypothetical protein
MGARSAINQLITASKAIDVASQQNCPAFNQRLAKPVSGRCFVDNTEQMGGPMR